MRLILLGPPGAGKGSLAQLLHERWRLPHIASGELLRHAQRVGSPLGQQAQECLARGELVPDPVVTALVLDRLTATVRSQGFVLDGFPRTERQASELDADLHRTATPIDRVVELATGREMIVWRLAGRRVCRACGAIYHVTNRPPQRDGACDRCGGGLEQREDDRPETIAQRMTVYEHQTAPLVAYYRQRGVLRVMDGHLAIEALYDALIAMFRQERLVCD